MGVTMIRPRVTDNLPALIHQRREELGLTQDELGERIGCSQRNISRIEQPKVNAGQPPAPDVIHALSDALELPVIDLLRAAGYRIETGCQTETQHHANAETILLLVDEAWDLDPKARVAIKALIELGRR